MISKWLAFLTRIQNFLYDPRKRTTLCVILTFLVPITGWVPIELLWLGNLCFLWKETAQRKIRFLYGFLIVFVSGLILWNLTARFFLPQT